MTSASDNLEPARQRIQAAYHPELLRAAAHRLSDLLADHLRHVQSPEAHVLNWRRPHDNIAAAHQLLEGAESPASPADTVDAFARLAREMLDRGQNLHNPRYLGHQVPAPVPLAGLFDAVGSVTNQVMAIYEMGPWSTAVERALVERLAEQIGWSAETSAGLVTHGGSLANLTALLTARNVACAGTWEDGMAAAGAGRGLVVHADAHYSIARAAGVLGLGTRHVVRAGLDGRRRMDPAQLDRTLVAQREAGAPPFAVVACACATPSGAFDPLVEIADVCRRHGVWLHVDAAHGGAALFSRKHRRLLEGIEQADSVVWDAHKMLFVPALCAFVLYKNSRHRFETFRQDAPYLFDPSAPGLAEYDSGLLTLECTKRAAAFGLWGLWSLYGAQLFEDLVDVTFDLAHRLYEKLRAAPDFEPLHEPQCNIVAFRYRPPELAAASLEDVGAFQLDLRRALIESGRFYIVQTKWNGAGALRATLINPLTSDHDLDDLLDTLRALGRERLAK